MADQAFRTDRRQALGLLAGLPLATAAGPTALPPRTPRLRSASLLEQGREARHGGGLDHRRREGAGRWARGSSAPSARGTWRWWTRSSAPSTRSLAIRVVNQGISGNTVRDLKARWKTDVMDLKPDWVSIMIGTNDVWRQFDLPREPETHVGIEEYEKTLGELVAETKAATKGLVLMTPFYIEPNRTDAMRATMDRYGAVVKALAGEARRRSSSTRRPPSTRSCSATTRPRSRGIGSIRTTSARWSWRGPSSASWASSGIASVLSRGTSMTEIGRRGALKLMGGVPVAVGFALSTAEAQVAHEHAAKAVAAASSGFPYKPKFFTPHEWQTVRTLVDLIIPRDERSGSATDAGVPEFMDFIMTDPKENDRGASGARRRCAGGLAWIDSESVKRFGHDFVSATEAERHTLLDDIAFSKGDDDDDRPDPRDLRVNLRHGPVVLQLVPRPDGFGILEQQDRRGRPGLPGEHVRGGMEGVPPRGAPQAGIGGLGAMASRRDVLRTLSLGSIGAATATSVWADTLAALAHDHAHSGSAAAGRGGRLDAEGPERPPERDGHRPVGGHHPADRDRGRQGGPREPLRGRRPRGCRRSRAQGVRAGPRVGGRAEPGSLRRGLRRGARPTSRPPSSRS